MTRTITMTGNTYEMAGHFIEERCGAFDPASPGVWYVYDNKELEGEPLFSSLHLSLCFDAIAEVMHDIEAS